MKKISILAFILLVSVLSVSNLNNDHVFADESKNKTVKVSKGQRKIIIKQTKKELKKAKFKDKTNNKQKNWKIMRSNNDWGLLYEDKKTDPIKVSYEWTGKKKDKPKVKKLVVGSKQIIPKYKKKKATSSDDREVIAKKNASKYPGDSVAKFSGKKFIGMDYYFEGKVIETTSANNIGRDVVSDSYLVENTNGYRMLVTPYYDVEIPNETDIKAFGHLNGNGYGLKESDKSGINDEAGLINAYKIFVNDKELGIEYFGPEDL